MGDRDMDLYESHQKKVVFPLVLIAFRDFMWFFLRFL